MITERELFLSDEPHRLIQTVPGDRLPEFFPGATDANDVLDRIWKKYRRIDLIPSGFIREYETGILLTPTHVFETINDYPPLALIRLASEIESFRPLTPELVILYQRISDLMDRIANADSVVVD